MSWIRGALRIDHESGFKCENVT